jgi:HSP20 family protein
MPDKDSSQPTQTPQRQKGSDSGQSSQTKQTGNEPSRSQQVPSGRDWFTPSLWRENPFAMMQRLSTQMDRLFDTFGRGGGLFGSSLGRSGEMGWSPEIEVYERNNQLVVCADLPGMKKDDIHVEITDDALVIKGERKQEFSDTQDGFQRSERSYGSFYRTISLPDGVNPEQLQANFQNGVLKITVPLPAQQQRQSRRIEIQEKENPPGRENSQSSSKTGPATHSDSSLNQ